jgi:magnesium transporter
MLYRNEEVMQIQAEQVSIIIGSGFVITFQEQVGDVFSPIRGRIKNAKGRIRNMGADYLAYALIDAVVDNYYVMMEKQSERMEEIEDELGEAPTPETSQRINSLKSELLFVRKMIWPLREIISGLRRGESALIKDSTLIYLNDVYDHTIQVIDTIEIFRDIISGMFDTYLANVSNKMNEVMKVLTIIATIFIPLTFIAGIYGMNFNPEVSIFNMPELNFRYGYLISIGAMILLAFGMILFFKRKKWL